MARARRIGLDPSAHVRLGDRRRCGSDLKPSAFAHWIAEVTGGPVPRFEKVEREEPADGVVIEGDGL
jgi:hypothetical protein